MSDDFDQLRQLRPDRVQPDDPAEPTVFAREKERLMSTIDTTARSSSGPETYAHARLSTHASPTTTSAPRSSTSCGCSSSRRSARRAPRPTSDARLAARRRRCGDDRPRQRRGPPDPQPALARQHDGADDGVRPTMSTRTTRTRSPRAPTITMPVEDAFYGERRYEATDLEGHRWHFGERFDQIKARGGSVPDSVSEHCD